MEIDMIIADENQLNNKEVNQVSVGPAENKKSS